MRLKLTTRVAPRPSAVFPVFGDALFVESLAPPVMGVRVTRIGLRKGDEIHVRVGALGPAGQWVSRIDELHRTRDEIWFVDRSLKAPWPFASFRHRHGFVWDGEATVLIDDVAFRTRPGVLELPMLPVLYGSLAYRRPVYERRFGRA